MLLRDYVSSTAAMSGTCTHQFRTTTVNSLSFRSAFRWLHQHHQVPTPYASRCETRNETPGYRVWRKNWLNAALNANVYGAHPLLLLRQVRHDSLQSEVRTAVVIGIQHISALITRCVCVLLRHASPQPTRSTVTDRVIYPIAR